MIAQFCINIITSRDHIYFILVDPTLFTTLVIALVEFDAFVRFSILSFH